VRSFTASWPDISTLPGDGLIEPLPQKALQPFQGSWAHGLQFQVEATHQLDGSCGSEGPFFDAFAIERIQDLIETTKAVGYVVALLIDRDMGNPDACKASWKVFDLPRNPVTDLAHFQKVFLRSGHSLALPSRLPHPSVSGIGYDP